jgi:hypothetical protein
MSKMPDRKCYSMNGTQFSLIFKQKIKNKVIECLEKLDVPLFFHFSAKPYHVLTYF